MGVLDESARDVYDIEVSRRQPSLQLVGRPDHRTLDLPILQEQASWGKMPAEHAQDFLQGGCGRLAGGPNLASLPAAPP